MKKITALGFALLFSVISAFAGNSHGGHHGSSSGYYKGGHGSSHKGGHYKNTSTHNHYRTKKNRY